MNNSKIKQNQSAIMGLVVGDALGVPVEFTSRQERKQDPVVNMRAYGSHGQPAGTWSDDSSMVVATMEWYNEHGKEADDYKALMDKFCSWSMHGEYTAYGSKFDIGLAVNRALIKYSKGAEPINSGDLSGYSNGNGSLMRILPTSLIHAKELAEEDYKCVKKIYNMSSLTHGHARSKLACLIYSKMVADIMYKKDVEKVSILEHSMASLNEYLINQEIDSDIRNESSFYNRVLDVMYLIHLDESEIKSSGYVVDTLEAAVWCFATTNSYSECVLKAVNLGDDTDTVGAVAGGLAGLYYGIENIPEEWINIIPKKDWIMKLASGMAE